MSQKQTVVFVHGLGETPDAWAHRLATLPEGFAGVSVAIPGLAPGDLVGGFSLAGAARGIVGELDRQEIERAHFVGLSLGAMIALQIATDHPQRVRSLTLAAGQVKPPRALMAVQNVVMGLLPARLIEQGGASKTQLLAALRAVAGTDFTARLETVSAPTLVLCGSKDRANLPASRALAAGIPGAELRIVDGAGHQAQLQKPEAFSDALHNFLIPLA